MPIEGYEYQTEFARKYVAQGKAEGKAEGIAEGMADGMARAVLQILQANAACRYRRPRSRRSAPAVTKAS